MDVDQIRRLEPKLAKFLDRFDDCFPRKDTRAHLPVYVSGQLSDIPEKSVEPIAINAGVPPRTLQEFLSQHHWDDDRAARPAPADRPRRARRAHTRSASSTRPATSRRGTRPPACSGSGAAPSARRRTASSRSTSPTPATASTACSTASCTCRESWADDRDRCREAGIPDDMVYRPKWKIALELYDRADRQRPALRLDDLRRGLRQQARVPAGAVGPRPEVRGRGAAELHGLAQAAAGRHPAVPQARPRPRPQDAPAGQRQPAGAAGRRDARRADGFRDQPWVKWRVKDGHKGPMVWEVKHLRFYPVGADGLPGEPLHLIVARDVLNPAELKFFVSNAPRGDVGPGRCCWSRSRGGASSVVSRTRRSEIGLDQYEGRRYQGLKRHLILSCVSYLFLSRMRQEFGGEKSGADGVPDAHGGGGVDPVLVVELSAGRRAVAGANVGEEDRSGRSAGTPRRGRATPSGHGRRLRAFGIKLTELPRCKWDTT